MYKLSEHKDELITHLIKNLMWAPIAAVFPAGIALFDDWFKTVKSKENEFLTSTNILIIVSIVLSVVCFFFLKISVVDKLKNQEKEIDNAKEKSVSSKFRADVMEAELSFNNREMITSKLTYHMNVLTNGITEMERLITWTGTTYKKTTIEDCNGNYSLIDSDRRNSPHPIKILFNTEKNSGDFIRFTTVTDVEDGKREMSPHYSFMVKYQINELILHVVAPRNLIKNVRKAVYADIGKEIVVERSTNISAENIGNLVRYTYKINNPTFLYNYFIEWEFTN